jgi:nitrogen fixation NifU-like protein
MVKLPYSKEVIKHFKHPKNLGRIKNADAVGEAGNLLCVLPETLVEINPLIKPIQDVRENDLILSHTGEYYPIQAVYKRNYKGKIISIKNRLGEVLLTPDHLVLAKKIPQRIEFLQTKNKKKIPSQWYHATELKKGDILAYPIPAEEKDVPEIKLQVKKFKYDFRSRALPSFISLDENFLKLVGYYLAEGHASTKVKNSFLQFTLNAREEEIKTEIIKTVRKIFGLEAKTYYHENSISIFIFNSLLARFFEKMFGGCAETKHLPHFMMFLPKQKQRYIIYGLWRGDGYINLNRKNPRAGYSTISLVLAQQLKLLLLRQEIIPSLYVEKEKTVKGVHHRKSYRIHIGQKDSLLNLCKILGIKWDTQKFSQRKSWIEENYLYAPITKIQRKNYSGVVYNLEVKRAHSFVTNCATLHNCGDVMRIYLKIKEKEGKKVISDIKGEVFGCLIAIANTSMLTTMVKGKTLEEAMKIKKEELIRKLGGKEKIPAFKIHCSILALDALHEAIYNYYKKKKVKIPPILEKTHKRIQKTLRSIEKRHKEFVELERKILGK